MQAEDGVLKVEDGDIEDVSLEKKILTKMMKRVCIGLMNIINKGNESGRDTSDRE